jgi:hypothetical protein
MQTLRLAACAASIAALLAAHAFAQSPRNGANAESQNNATAVAAPRPDPEQTTREERLQERNVAAQEAIRNLTLALAIVAVVQVIVGFLALLVTNKAANAATNSANAASDSIKLARSSTAIALAQKRLGDRQLEQMKAQTAANAEAARAAADNAKAAADNAASAADALATNREIEHAYVSFVHDAVYLAGEPDGHGGMDARAKPTRLTVKMVIRNTGKTPGTFLGGYIGYSLGGPARRPGPVEGPASIHRRLSLSRGNRWLQYRR